MVASGLAACFKAAANVGMNAPAGFGPASGVPGCDSWSQEEDGGVRNEGICHSGPCAARVLASSAAQLWCAGSGEGAGRTAGRGYPAASVPTEFGRLSGRVPTLGNLRYFATHGT